MADKSWKAFERRLAARVGGARIPVTGERDGADVIAGRSSIRRSSGAGSRHTCGTGCGASSRRASAQGPSALSSGKHHAP